MGDCALATTLVEQNIGRPPSPAGSGADGDGSGGVDALDLAVWQSAFGSGAIISALASRVVAATNDGGIALGDRDSLCASGDFTVLFAAAELGGKKSRSRRV